MSDEILSKFGICGTPEYQRVTTKGLRTMGSEWPDKQKRPGSVASGQGWGEFFLSGYPIQLNIVGSGMVWVTGLFSQWMLKPDGPLSTVGDLLYYLMGAGVSGPPPPLSTDRGEQPLQVVSNHRIYPNWAFPDCNSSLKSPMATKWCTKLEVA